MTAYYNEIDPFACEWLKNLMDAGEIPYGTIDQRSIEDVQANELAEYTHVHLFAGCGGWPLALRLAGWPDDRPAWTGSAPCQSFSVAGKQQGTSDHRHLWPEMYRLIRECRPPIIIGEQVASSLIVGRSDNQGAKVQEVRDRETILRVLREFQGQQGDVQGMRKEEGSTRKAVASPANVGFFQSVEAQKERIRTCECCETQGEEAWIAVQSRLAGYSESDRCRILRAYGHPLFVGHSAGVERAVDRPHRLKEGVYGGQHQDCFVFDERDGEYMGAREDFGDCVGDHGEEEVSIESLIGEIRGGDESETGRVWLDGVSCDLEKAGYAVGPVVLGAGSVGAPHKRSRLFWVAVAGGAAGEWNAGRFPEAETGIDRAGKLDGGLHFGPEYGGAVDTLAVANGLELRGVASTGQQSIDERDGSVIAVADGESRGFGIDGGTPRHAGHVDERGELGTVGITDIERSCEGRLAIAANGHRHSVDATGGASTVGHNSGTGLARRPRKPGHDGTQQPPAERASDNAWSDFTVAHCRDGKSRRVGRGIQPLAHVVPRDVGRLISRLEGMGVDAGTIERKLLARFRKLAAGNRVGRLRGYGNAIVAELGAEFVRTVMEIL